MPVPLGVYFKLHAISLLGILHSPPPEARVPCRKNGIHQQSALRAQPAGGLHSGGSMQPLLCWARMSSAAPPVQHCHQASVHHTEWPCPGSHTAPTCYAANASPTDRSLGAYHHSGTACVSAVSATQSAASTTRTTPQHLLQATIIGQHVPAVPGYA
jgi:hypothetical protein